MSRALLLSAAILLAGCGYTETHEVVLRAPSPASGRSVEVYMYGQSPPRPFYEVALLQVVGHGSDANLEDVIKGLTARASALGCDALVRIQIDQGYSLTHGFGVCVKWAQIAAPPPRPPAPAPAPAPAATTTPPPAEL